MGKWEWKMRMGNGNGEWFFKLKYFSWFTLKTQMPKKEYHHPEQDYKVVNKANWNEDPAISKKTNTENLPTCTVDYELVPKCRTGKNYMDKIHGVRSHMTKCPSGFKPQKQYGERQNDDGTIDEHYGFRLKPDGSRIDTSKERSAEYVCVSRSKERRLFQGKVSKYQDEETGEWKINDEYYRASRRAQCPYSTRSEFAYPASVQIKGSSRLYTENIEVLTAYNGGKVTNPTQFLTLEASRANKNQKLKEIFKQAVFDISKKSWKNNYGNEDNLNAKFCVPLTSTQQQDKDFRTVKENVKQQQVKDLSKEKVKSKNKRIVFDEDEEEESNPADANRDVVNSDVVNPADENPADENPATDDEQEFSRPASSGLVAAHSSRRSHASRASAMPSGISTKDRISLASKSAVPGGSRKKKFALKRKRTSKTKPKKKTCRKRQRRR